MVAISSAQSERTQRFRDMQCQLEVQQMPLDAQLLDRQLSGLRVVVPSWMRPWQPRAECCQQLQDVSPECRCSAIRHMVRSYEQSLAPLEGGCGGDPGGQQQGGYFGGEQCRQQGGYCGETEQQLAGGCCSKREQWQPKQNRGYIGFPPRTRTGQQTTREKLTKLRQYARELPAMCRIEPQKCSIFAACQY
ncbi:hypothetical protein PR202_gb01707 [Eleusine coracana subsp. coracana]|uniref:Bifunctional inhibitor/plant lipid transfer protein/seed storage helical domain-containing protein n=1 Tax=Eleusine coracana subsp. coracana TaxID=191504 RepID=A0AAV5DWL6_ELECO|nr:hypothetical protein QOZ80_5BG0415480 [Eleusine coracana subsp. coracana]GJN14842.1 hypothetical protein PR202_gb01707 [Eleusine coracana subsp. coracana]